MSYRRNSTTLYLRPSYNQQAYQIRNAAKWLATRKGLDQQYTLNYLISLQDNKPWDFKAIMASYYDYNDYKSNYKTSEYSNNYDINYYHTSNKKSYGQEEHMWY